MALQTVVTDPHAEARRIAESWAETEYERDVSDRDSDVVLARAYLDLSAREERLREALAWISDPSYVGNYAPLEVIEIHRKWARQALEDRGSDSGALVNPASEDSGEVERLGSAAQSFPEAGRVSMTDPHAEARARMRYEDAIQKHAPLTLYESGLVEGLRMYSWMKDGVIYVGTTGTTLGLAVDKAITEARDLLGGK